MDAASLAGITAKLNRADEHLIALADEISHFIDSEPHDYSLQVNPNVGHYSVRIAVKQSPPLRLAIICGDYIHNLRSALDHAICALVPTVTRSTQFPIYSTPADFASKVTSPAQAKKRGPLTGLDPAGELFAYIERAQPYNGRHGVDHHPLWLLAELSNADKHRAILTTASSHAQSADLHIGGDGIEFIGKAELIYDQPLIDGAEVLRGRFKLVAGSQPQVQVYGHLPIDVAFGDLLLPTESLNGLANATRETIGNIVTLSTGSM